MSGSLIIVLIIVVWLFVLAPLLLRGQKPIHKAGEAFDDTRVIHEGGTADLPVRRRPRLTPRRQEEKPEPEEVEVEDVLLDDLDDLAETAKTAKATEAEEAAEDVDVEAASTPRTFSGLFTRSVTEPAEEVAEEPAEIVEGGIVHELEPVAAAEEDSGVVTADVEELLDDEWDDWDEETTYAYDDTYTSPADLMYPDSVDSVVEVLEDAEESEDTEDPDEDAGAVAEGAEAAEHEDGDGDVEDIGDIDELSAEEIEFAEHRAARGGWDPVADAEHSLSRYQRRQRTLLGLGAAVVLTAVLAFIVGGWTWLLAGAAVLTTGAYLVALRNQVLAEQALRARRVRQLRRARLGVLSSADEELAIPRHLRHPGAVVLERDDESPDFDHLPVVRSRVSEEPAPTRDRTRFHDDRRAG